MFGSQQNKSDPLHGVQGVRIPLPPPSEHDPIGRSERRYGEGRSSMSLRVAHEDVAGSYVAVLMTSTFLAGRLVTILILTLIGTSRWRNFLTATARLVANGMSKSA